MKTCLPNCSCTGGALLCGGPGPRPGRCTRGVLHQSSEQPPRAALHHMPGPGPGHAACAGQAQTLPLRRLMRGPMLSYLLQHVYSENVAETVRKGTASLQGIPTLPSLLRQPGSLPTHGRTALGGTVAAALGCADPVALGCVGSSGPRLLPRHRMLLVLFPLCRSHQAGPFPAASCGSGESAE